MDNTTKNKVIAAFMGVKWYDCWVECIEEKKRLFSEKCRDQSTEECRLFYLQLEEQHQWCPEYHTTYDRLIPVAMRLNHAIFENFGCCEFFYHFIVHTESKIWHNSREGLFNLLYETILQFNQLTKNKDNVASQSTTQ